MHVALVAEYVVMSVHRFILPSAAGKFGLHEGGNAIEKNSAICADLGHQRSVWSGRSAFLVRVILQGKHFMSPYTRRRKLLRGTVHDF